MTSTVIEEIYLPLAETPGAHSEFSFPISTPGEARTPTAEVECGLELAPIIPDHAVDVEDIPPDGGYGWVCTACLFFINANTWGINSAWGVFLAQYLSHSTFPEANQIEYALIGGLSIALCLFISPAISILPKYTSSRIAMIIGSLMIALGLVCASFATRIWHLFVTMGACYGFGMGFLYLTATMILPQWFSQKRSLAVGLSAAGSGLGGLAYNLGTQKAIDMIGLPWTYRALALASLVCNLICSILLKDRNQAVKPSLHMFEVKAFRRAEVCLIAGWGIFTDVGFIVLLYSLPHYAVSIGLTGKQGSIVGAMMNLGLGIGRPFIGYYSDTWGRINTAGITTAACGIFCLVLWTTAHTFTALLCFALLVGVVCGTFWGTVTAVLVEVVGLKQLPSTLNLICISMVIPTTFAEPLALAIAAAGGFIPSQVFVGAVFLLGFVCLLGLRAWKVVEVESKSQVASEGGLGTSPPRIKMMQWMKWNKVFSMRRV